MKKRGITLEQAKNLVVGHTYYLNDMTNKDGTPRRFKVNGRVKTWVRQPNRVRIPCKHGLYDYGYLDETCLHRIELTKDF